MDKQTETRELVERLAREAGDDWDSTLPDDKAFLERFAALDRVAGLASFQRGNFASDLIRRINLRELTHEQANAELAAYDAANR